MLGSFPNEQLHLLINLMVHRAGQVATRAICELALDSIEQCDRSVPLVDHVTCSRFERPNSHADVQGADLVCHGETQLSANHAELHLHSFNVCLRQA